MVEVSIPEDLKERMREFPAINWSHVVQDAVEHDQLILRKGVSLTDLLTGLLDSKKKRWDEKECENYLLRRSS